MAARFDFHVEPITEGPRRGSVALQLFANDAGRVYQEMFAQLTVDQVDELIAQLERAKARCRAPR